MSRKSNTWYRVATIDDRCQCCGRDLYGHAIRMLELDQRIDAYHDLGGVPENQSQGAFPFGLACAKKKLKQAEKLLDELKL